MIISTFCNPTQTQVSIAEQSRPLSNKGQSALPHYVYVAKHNPALIHSSRRDMNLKTRYIITIYHDGRRPEAAKHVRTPGGLCG